MLPLKILSVMVWLSSGAFGAVAAVIEATMNDGADGGGGRKAVSRMALTADPGGGTWNSKFLAGVSCIVATSDSGIASGFVPALLAINESPKASR